MKRTKYRTEQIRDLKEDHSLVYKTVFYFNKDFFDLEERKNTYIIRDKHLPTFFPIEKSVVEQFSDEPDEWMFVHDGEETYNLDGDRLWDFLDELDKWD